MQYVNPMGNSPKMLPNVDVSNFIRLISQKIDVFVDLGIMCKYPGAPTNGKTKPFRREYNVDDVVTYECDKHLELIGQKSAKCLSTGEFTSAPPKCKGNVEPIANDCYNKIYTIE